MISVATVDPDAQVPLLDRLSDGGRELLAGAEDVAGDWIVNTRPVRVVQLAEVLDLGLVERMSGGAYRLTVRGVAVRLFVPRPRC